VRTSSASDAPSVVDLARRREVERRWRWGTKGTQNRYWLRQPLAEAALLPQLLLAILALVSGAALLNLNFLESPWDWPRAISPLLGPVLVLGGGTISAWVVCACLRQSERAGPRVPVWPSLLCLLPGLTAQLALALWRVRAPAAGEVSPAARSRSAREPTRMALAVPWVSVGQFASVGLGLLLAAHHFDDLPRESLAVGLVLAQGGGLTVGRLSSRDPHRPDLQAARCRLAWLWLLPILGPIFALVGLFRLDQPSAREHTLCYYAYVPRGTVRSLRAWRESLGQRRRAAGLQGWWERWRARRGRLGLDGVTVERVRAAQIKVVVLLLDATALGWVAGVALRRYGLNLDDLVGPWIRALPSFVLLPAAGWLTSALRLRGGADQAPRFDVALYAACQLAVGSFLGLALGLAAEKNDVLRGWLLLQALGGLVGVGGSLLSTGGGSRAQPGTRPWFYAFVSLGLMVAAVPFALVPAFDRSLLAALPLLAVAVNLLWSWRARARILHPFLPADTRDPSLPFPARLGVGFLKATLALPLGGLFVPFWPAAFHLLERTAGPERRRRWGQEATADRAPDQPSSPRGVFVR
jgi:hypothetical protein